MIFFVISVFVLVITAVEGFCRTKFKPVTKYIHQLIYILFYMSYTYMDCGNLSIKLPSFNPIRCGGGSGQTPPWRYQLPFCGGCTN